jgi:hypothetical protein
MWEINKEVQANMQLLVLIGSPNFTKNKNAKEEAKGIREA